MPPKKKQSGGRKRRRKVANPVMGMNQAGTGFFSDLWDGVKDVVVPCTSQCFVLAVSCSKAVVTHDCVSAVRSQVSSAVASKSTLLRGQ